MYFTEQTFIYILMQHVCSVKYIVNMLEKMRGKSAGKRNQVNIFEFDWLSGLNKHYVNKFQYGGVSSAKK